MAQIQAAVLACHFLPRGPEHLESPGPLPSSVPHLVFFLASLVAAARLPPSWLRLVALSILYCCFSCRFCRCCRGQTRQSEAEPTKVTDQRALPSTLARGFFLS